MTEYTSPENLHKFLESNDPAMVMMGLSMAKAGFTEQILPTILRLYMWSNNKNIRATAKTVFSKHSPKEIQDKIKLLWKANYRTKLLFKAGDKFFDYRFESIGYQRNYLDKIKEDFEKITLFYEGLQKQELACIILIPFIYFLGHSKFLPLTNNEDSRLRAQYPPKWIEIFENQIMISAIKSLKFYGLKNARSKKLHGNFTLLQTKGSFDSTQNVRKNVEFILDFIGPDKLKAKRLIEKYCWKNKTIKQNLFK